MDNVQNCGSFIEICIFQYYYSNNILAVTVAIQKMDDSNFFILLFFRNIKAAKTLGV
jgi:hypothetical protein